MTTVFHDGIFLGRRRYTNARPVKRTMNYFGLPLSIEYEIGDVKSGIGEDGKEWQHKYTSLYGEIPSSKALSDGDACDVYVGPSHTAKFVYVIHQLKFDGSYDEDKIMLGYDSDGEAILAYKQHGPPFGFGSRDVMTFEQFKFGYLASNRKYTSNRK